MIVLYNTGDNINSQLLTHIQKKKTPQLSKPTKFKIAYQFEYNSRYLNGGVFVCMGVSRVFFVSHYIFLGAVGTHRHEMRFSPN